MREKRENGAKEGRGLALTVTSVPRRSRPDLEQGCVGVVGWLDGVDRERDGESCWPSMVGRLNNIENSSLAFIDSVSVGSLISRLRPQTALVTLLTPLQPICQSHLFVRTRLFC